MLMTALATFQNDFRLHARVALDEAGIATGIDMFCSGSMTTFAALARDLLTFERRSMAGLHEAVIRVLMASLTNVRTDILGGFLR
jgi:hypothetical protein